VSCGRRDVSRRSGVGSNTLLKSSFTVSTAIPEIIKSARRSSYSLPGDHKVCQERIPNARQVQAAQVQGGAR
jgi:hypothetical protein